MITRFRIEGEGKTKENLIEILSDKAEKFIRMLDQKGDWECTDDAVTRRGTGYIGRMVFKFHEEHDGIRQS